MNSAGNSKVSSRVRILALRIISVRKEPSKDVFPELLVPATNIVALLSIRKLNNPAANVSMNLFLGWMYKGNVHGKSRCLRKEKVNPVGLNGAVSAETLDVKPVTFNSVSKMGLASSNGRPEINLNLVAQLSTSKTVG